MSQNFKHIKTKGGNVQRQEFVIEFLDSQKSVKGIPWQSSGLSLLRAWVQSLVRALKSHKPLCRVKKKFKMYK